MQIRQIGNALRFDNVFEITIPNGATFSPETEENSPSLDEIAIEGAEDTINVSFLNSDEDAEPINRSGDVECNILISTSDAGAFFGIIPTVFFIHIRVGTKAYLWSGVFTTHDPDTMLPYVTATLTQILQTARRPDGTTLNLKDHLVVIQEDSEPVAPERNLDGTVATADTRVTVCNEWTITVPKGYIYRASDDHHKLIFMKNDETADFDNHYSANENFSCVFFEKEGYEPGCTMTSYPYNIHRTDEILVSTDTCDEAFVSRFLPGGDESQYSLIDLTADLVSAFSGGGESDLLSLRAGVATRRGIYSILISFNNVPKDPTIVRQYYAKAIAWLQTITAAGETLQPAAIFPYAAPSKPSYPRLEHLRQLAGNVSRMGLGVNMFGQENHFIPLAEFAEYNSEDSRRIAVIRRVATQDTPNTATNELCQAALAMSAVFHVSASDYDSMHDRESHIREGYLRRGYQFHALRSYAWTLMEYAQGRRLSLNQITGDTAVQLADYSIYTRDCLNYRPDSHCPALCGGTDLHIYYVPDTISETDRAILMPTQEKLDEEKEAEADGRIILVNDVRSLDQLRQDLADIYPAIYLLWQRVAQHKNFDTPEAMILYAWCALAAATKTPFFLEDGDDESFEQKPPSMLSVPRQLRLTQVKAAPASAPSAPTPAPTPTAPTPSPAPAKPETIAIAKTGTVLVPGQRVSCAEIAGAAIRVQLFCANSKNTYEMDCYSFLLGANDKVLSDSDLIFFNQTKSADKAVQLNQNTKFPQVTLRLSQLAEAYQKVDICFSLYANSPTKTFGQLQDCTVQILSGGREWAHLDLQGLGQESSIVALSFYRHRGEWKVRCIGQGYRDELGTLCRSYGVDIEA